MMFQSTRVDASPWSPKKAVGSASMRETLAAACVSLAQGSLRCLVFAFGCFFGLWPGFSMAFLGPFYGLLFAFNLFRAFLWSLAWFFLVFMPGFGLSYGPFGH